MAVRLLRKALIVSSGILLLLPYITADGGSGDDMTDIPEGTDDCGDDGDLPFLKPDCITTTNEGKLALGVIVVVVLIIILVFILILCCCYYCCCSKKGWPLQ